MRLMSRLNRFKIFSKQAWGLTLPYFRSEERWKAAVLLASIIALNLAAVYMLVMLNNWNRLFYDSLQNKNEAVFWTQLVRFIYLAFIFIVIAVYKFYLTQLLEMRWRAWMTGHYLKRWLSKQAFYKLELSRFKQNVPGQSILPDNPDQRIQEDINSFTSYTVSLSMGLLNAVVTLASFIGILWVLSGNFSFNLMGSTFTIPGFMVWMALLYCSLGSVLTHYIGRPQISLNFNQERLEADFRHHMVRVREYSESIALDGGEKVEKNQLDMRFTAVLANYLNLLKAKKNLTWFTVGFGQAAAVFPFLVAAPRFFSGAIQLGELMQIASAFGRVQDALSWFVDSYSSLASWRATTDRLTSFEQVLADIDHAPDRLIISPAAHLQATHLDVSLPNQALLLSDAALLIKAGERVLLQGPSGSGKSTLFRVFSGIWPHVQGQLERPKDTMFIPQRPYFPNGTLRDALAYPNSPDEYTDEQLEQALRDAILPDMVTKLNTSQAWSQDLSGGEQQRLAVARVLLKKPSWVFADEATSALDTETESKIYQQLVAMVEENEGALISISHRPALSSYHNKIWSFVPSPKGEGGPFVINFNPK